MNLIKLALAALALAPTLLSRAAAAAGPAQYVITISVDGMGSQYVQPLLTAGSLPNLQTIIDQGATTLNARTDAAFAITLPNHTSMLTGRPVNDYAIPLISGHNWTANDDPAPGQTLATNKGAYVASVFDVTHDSGLRTAMWAGKSKFSLYRDSYDAANGAPDANPVAGDNGRNKLDNTYIHPNEAVNLVADNFITGMSANPYNFSFIHFQDTDLAGHSFGWGSSPYNAALMAVDTQIGNILSMVQTDPTLKDKTAIIITADHGGHDNNHGDLTLASDYTIPFLVWGAGVTHGDLYDMNPGILLAPPTTGGAAGMPQYSGLQPIRNGDLGNLSLDLLGLGPIPGSFIGVSQNIAVPEPASLGVLAIASAGLMRRPRGRPR